MRSQKRKPIMQRPLKKQKNVTPSRRIPDANVISLGRRVHPGQALTHSIGRGAFGTEIGAKCSPTKAPQSKPELKTRIGQGRRGRKQPKELGCRKRARDFFTTAARPAMHTHSSRPAMPKLSAHWTTTVLPQLAPAREHMFFHIANSASLHSRALSLSLSLSLSLARSRNAKLTHRAGTNHPVACMAKAVAKISEQGP